MCRCQAGYSFPIHCLNGASRRKAPRRGSIQPLAHFILLTRQRAISRDFAGIPKCFPSEVLMPEEPDQRRYLGSRV
jgi:hypothetical protein